MAKKRNAKAPDPRARITSIARELAGLRTRKEELERERRKAKLTVSDALLDWWVVSDLRERRWNTEPPPLAAERVRP
jgi:hypothetical protein